MSELPDRLREAAEKVQPEFRNLLLEASLSLVTLQEQKADWQRSSERFANQLQDLASRFRRYL